MGQKFQALVEKGFGRGKCLVSLELWMEGMEQPLTSTKREEEAWLTQEAQTNELESCEGVKRYPRVLLAPGLW